MRLWLLILLLGAACVEPSHQALFCPEDPCEATLITELGRAEHTIDCAIYSFTLDNVSDALLSAKNRGVRVRVLFEAQQVSVRGSEYSRLHYYGIARLDSNPALMHNKFCVIDGNTVITGSYNWSEQATRKNNENLLILHDPGLAGKYKKEFNKLWGYTQKN